MSSSAADSGFIDGRVTRLHPTDKTLQLLRPGQARRRLGRIGRRSTWRRARIAAAASPRSPPTASSAGSATPRARPDSCRLRSSPPLAGLSMLDGGSGVAGTAPGRHAAPGTGRPPRLRDPPRARPGRHGRRLPGPEHAHGPAWRSSRSSAATWSTAAACSDRFLGEIRNAARLHHPNIVTAYSAIRLGESLVLAMEYVEGLDLAQLVKAKGPLPVANACNFVHQAALGLQHAHEHGMVHRDIKPGNLMLARQGNRAVVKVLDFGLAKVDRARRRSTAALTHEGQMLGTPDYIAPEQIRRRAAGRHPRRHLQPGLHALLPPDRRPAVRRGRASTTSSRRTTRWTRTPLNLVRPEVPVELAALVAKMMAKEPERRFQTPAEVAQALKPFFKPGANPVSGSSPEISRVGQAASSPQPVGGGSAPAQPTTPGTAPAPCATESVEDERWRGWRGRA